MKTCTFAQFTSALEKAIAFNLKAERDDDPLSFWHINPETAELSDYPVGDCWYEILGASAEELGDTSELQGTSDAEIEEIAKELSRIFALDGYDRMCEACED